MARSLLWPRGWDGRLGVGTVVRPWAVRWSVRVDSVQRSVAYSVKA